MKRPVISFLMLCVFMISTGRAGDVEIFGYYEPQYLGIYIEDEYSQLFSNKLRVDFRLPAVNHVTFAANLNYINYQGRSRWNLLDYLPDKIAALAPPGADTLFDFDYSDTLLLDNAYVKLALSIFDLTLGKQQISIGTGYAWNPTDLFNAKDMIDPAYEQSGHTAVRLDAALSSRYSAEIALLPEIDWRESGKLVRLKGKISHFDYSAVYVEKPWQLSDLADSGAGISIRHLYGGDVAGELLGLGVWGEFGFNTLNGHGDFWEILAGADYTFDNGLYAMTEYYRNELGESDYRQYALDDWLRFYNAESRTISRDNLYFYIDFPLTDLLHLGNSIITSLSDRSFILVPAVHYSMFQNVEMDVFLNFNIGDENKAYSGEQGYGGIARLKVYF